MPNATYDKLKLMDDVEFLRFRIKEDKEFVKTLDDEIKYAENLIQSRKTFSEKLHNNIKIMEKELKEKGGGE